MSNTLGPVRLIGEFEVWGYCLLWGSPTRLNTKRQFWTPATAFGSPTLPMPLLWDHTYEHTSVRVGSVTALGNDAFGRWYRGNLNDALLWDYSLILGLVAEQRMGSSPEARSWTDITTVPAPNDTVEITRAEFSAVALTAYPSEPRLIADVGWLAALQPAYVKAALAVLAIEQRAAELEELFRQLEQLEKDKPKWHHRVSPNWKQS
jgi:hypothetical protein